MKTQILFLLMLSLSTSFANAAQESPQTFTLDGRLFSDANSTTPLLAASVTFKVQILNSAQDCVLYEESQATGTQLNNGYFDLQIGSPTSGTGSGKRTSGDYGNAMSKVFANKGSISGKLLSNGGACTYSPANGDQRFVRVTVTPSTDGVARILSPSLALDSVPNAQVAESLQGLTASDVLQLDPATSLTQSNVANVFTNANYSKLNGILSGSGGVLQTGVNGTVAMPSVSGNPSSGLAIGQVWYDSMANSLKFYNGTVQTLGGAGSYVSTAGGTVAGNFTITPTSGVGLTVTSGGASIAGGLGLSGGATVTGDSSFSGKVGIGTTTPATALDVAGAISISGVNGLSFPADFVANGSIAIGKGALAYQTAAGAVAGNTAVGYQAMSSATFAGNSNTAVGHTALQANTTGVKNVAVGYGVLVSNTSGQQNVGVGTYSLTANTTGQANMAIGHAALAAVTTGSNNTAIGLYSGNKTTASHNTMIGFQSGQNITTGANNLILGANAASTTLTTGSNNIILGNHAGIDAQAAASANTLNIGNLLYGTGLVTSGTTAGGSVGIGVAAPSARLHLPAGTTTANTGPLKFTAGPLTTASEDGTVEFYNHELYFTANGTRRKLSVMSTAGNDYVSVGSITGSGGLTIATGGSSQDLTLTSTGVSGNVNVNAGTSTGLINMGSPTRVTASTASSSSATGALVVTGGVGVGGALNVAGNTRVDGNLSIASAVPAAHTEATYPALWMPNGHSSIMSESGTYLGMVLGSNVARQPGPNYWVPVDNTKPTWMVSIASGSAVDAFQVARAGAGSDPDGAGVLFKVAGTGNVGVGTGSPSYPLSVSASGTKTAAFTSAQVSNTATTSTGSIQKVGLDIQSTGAWTATGSTNVGLNVSATGGTTNYAAIFQGGYVGIGTATPVMALDVNGRGSFVNSAASNYTSTGATATPVSAYILTMANYTGADNAAGLISTTVKNTAAPTSLNQIGYHGWISVTGGTNYSPAYVIGRSTGASSYAESFRIDKDGNVGIGTASPVEKLDVTGNIRSSGQISSASRTIASGTSTINWNDGNAISTDFNCGSNLTFDNLRDGGTYTLVVTSTSSTQCSFNTVTTGTDAATVNYRFKPYNAGRTPSSHTIYTLMRVGAVVYVSWTSGF